MTQRNGIRETSPQFPHKLNYNQKKKEKKWMKGIFIVVLEITLNAFGSTLLGCKFNLFDNLTLGQSNRLDTGVANESIKFYENLRKHIALEKNSHLPSMSSRLIASPNKVRPARPREIFSHENVALKD